MLVGHTDAAGVADLMKPDVHHFNMEFFFELIIVVSSEPALPHRMGPTLS